MSVAPPAPAAAIATAIATVIAAPRPAPAPQPPAADGVLAPAALALVERVGGAALLRQLVGLYAGYAPARFAEARAGLAAIDADAVRRACHALRSGSAQLGAARLAAACAALEGRAAAGDLRDAPAALDAIARELGAALSALETRAARGAAA